MNIIIFSEKIVNILVLSTYLGGIYINKIHNKPCLILSKNIIHSPDIIWLNFLSNLI